MADETSLGDDRPVARLVQYAGAVQGVGFRATTASMARRHPVTGYVRNLPDGRVEVLVEGTASAVQRFLDEVASYWSRHIRSIDVHDQTPSGMHDRFAITR
jgi:acylphosphatase